MTALSTTERLKMLLAQKQKARGKGPTDSPRTYVVHRSHAQDPAKDDLQRPHTGTGTHGPGTRGLLDGLFIT
jgi:hypothetical protein